MRSGAPWHVRMGRVLWILGHSEAAVLLYLLKAERPVIEIARQDHPYGIGTVGFGGARNSGSMAGRAQFSLGPRDR